MFMSTDLILKSAVDILLVGILIYFIFLLLRSTRALQLIIGSIVIVFLMNVATVISNRYGLLMLNWLLRSALQILSVSLPVILAVIFQPELRRFLGKLGIRRSVFSHMFNFIGFSYLKYETIEAICRAIEALSKNQVGALMVIERETPLESLLDSGIPMGSHFSTELALTVFTPPSLLHDGAMVIKQDIIVSSRVILPLTENLFISKNFGTRHRAGIGITEDTDAISLMVSEQDKRISLAVSGRITTNLTIPELREMLVVLCKVKKKK